MDADFTSLGYASLLAAVVAYPIILARLIAHAVLVVRRAARRQPLRIDPWFAACLALIVLAYPVFLAIRIGLGLSRSASEAIAFVPGLLIVFMTVIPIILSIVRERFRSAQNWMNYGLVVLFILALPFSIYYGTTAMFERPDTVLGRALQPYYSPRLEAPACSQFLIGARPEKAAQPAEPSAWTPSDSAESRVRTFTAMQSGGTGRYWMNETINNLLVDAPDSFGCTISTISHNPDSMFMDTLVFAYKLLCGLVVGSVLFGPILHGLLEHRRLARQAA